MFPGAGYSAGEGLTPVAQEAAEIRVLRPQGKSIRETSRMLVKAGLYLHESVGE
jgi:hypothetical protein